MDRFFKRLNYTFGNEDWQTESEALTSTPESRILCITASGDRPLHLLLDPCSSIVALDANPLQNHLLHLKQTAMEQLHFSDYLSFLGGAPSSSRLATFNRLTPHMQAESANFWSKNTKIIDKGVLFQGTLERRIKLAKFIFLFKRKQIQELFACKTLEEQRHYLKTRWNHEKWKRLFKWVPLFVRLSMQDPSIYAHKEEGINPGLAIYNRLMHCLHHSLASENPIISLIFRQMVDAKGYPPYLTADGYRKIKPNLNRLTTITQDAISYLEDVPESSFDRFSLSDIASYLNRKQFEKLMSAMYRAARPGARFCVRQLMTRYAIPGDLSPHFVRDNELEHRLADQDRAFFYHYTVGTILKT